MSVAKEKHLVKAKEKTTESIKEKSMALPDLILAGIMAAIVLIMFFQVFFRYVLNNSLTWSEEITRFLFIWVVFLGTALNIRDKWNIGVDVLVGILPRSFARSFHLLDLLFVLGFLIFLAVGGFIWMYYSGGSYSSALGLPLNLVLYGALPVTAVLGCHYTFIRIKKTFDPNSGEKGT